MANIFSVNIYILYSFFLETRKKEKLKTGHKAATQ